jgi:hypothetical protein
MGAERFRKILNQRGKKAVSSFGDGSLENRAQRFIGFKILERLGAIEWWRGHGGKL